MKKLILIIMLAFIGLTSCQKYNPNEATIVVNKREVCTGVDLNNNGIGCTYYVTYKDPTGSEYEIIVTEYVYNTSQIGK